MKAKILVKKKCPVCGTTAINPIGGGVSKCQGCGYEMGR